MPALAGDNVDQLCYFIFEIIEILSITIQYVMVSVSKRDISSYLTFIVTTS